MDTKSEYGKVADITREKILIFDNIIIAKKDLLRALSWFDFLPTHLVDSHDQESKDNLIKIVNYLTRKA